MRNEGVIVKAPDVSMDTSMILYTVATNSRVIAEERYRPVAANWPREEQQIIAQKLSRNAPTPDEHASFYARIFSPVRPIPPMNLKIWKSRLLLDIMKKSLRKLPGIANASSRAVVNSHVVVRMHVPERL
jgi:hypothetical protein